MNQENVKYANIIVNVKYFERALNQKMVTLYKGIFRTVLTAAALCSFHSTQLVCPLVLGKKAIHALSEKLSKLCKKDRQ